MFVVVMCNKQLDQPALRAERQHW